QERLWALMKEAARFYNEQLYAPGGANCLAYVQKRGLSKSIVTKFGIGYAPDSWNALVNAMRKKGYTDKEMIDADLVGEKNGRVFDRFRNRLMFPIIDIRGNVIGFGGRVLDNSLPKYINTTETIIFNKGKHLFGLNLSKKTKQDYMILVEGNVDVVTMHQYGFDNAVASMGTSFTEDQATLLKRYTEQVVLLYDGDAPGQKATRRAIPILEKVGIHVKVLQIPNDMDPDDYLREYGAERFKLLIEGSSNRVEYQINAILKKYNIAEDEQRIKFIQEAAELISTLGSAAQREIYGHRVAEVGKISFDTMKLEVNKAFKRRIAAERKKQEKVNLSPAETLQPKSRTIHYDNMKSAMAEEGVLALVLRDPTLAEQSKELTGSSFSVPLFGKVYDQIRDRLQKGMDISLGVLSDLTPEEMSHLAGVTQRQMGPVSQAAFRDCVKIILQAAQAKNVSSDDDLMAFRKKLKESK
ncbi:MAG: DNA primase, partial [Oscillospiraceae bacterium]|nr:DNA primase [Oscillospiraceae bacterium]